MDENAKQCTLKQALAKMETVLGQERNWGWRVFDIRSERPELVDGDAIGRLPLAKACAISWRSRTTVTIPGYIAALSDSGIIPDSAEHVLVLHVDVMTMPEDVEKAVAAGNMNLLAEKGVPGGDPLWGDDPGAIVYLDTIYPFILSNRPPERPSSSHMTGMREVAGWLYELYRALSDIPYPLMKGALNPPRDALERVAEVFSFLTSGRVAFPDVPDAVFDFPLEADDADYLAVPAPSSPARPIYEAALVAARLSEAVEAICHMAGISPTAGALRRKSPFRKLLDAAGFGDAAGLLLGEVPDRAAYDRWFGELWRDSVSARGRENPPAASDIRLPSSNHLFHPLDSEPAALSAKGFRRRDQLEGLVRNRMRAAGMRGEVRWMHFAVNGLADMEEVVIFPPDSIDACREGDWMLLPVATGDPGYARKLAAACALCGRVPEGVGKMAVACLSPDSDADSSLPPADEPPNIAVPDDILVPYDLSGGLFGGDDGGIPGLIDEDGRLSSPELVDDGASRMMRRLIGLAKCEFSPKPSTRWLLSVNAMSFMSGGRASAACEDIERLVDPQLLDELLSEDTPVNSALICLNEFGDSPLWSCPELDAAVEEACDLARIWTSRETESLLGFEITSLGSGLSDIGDKGMRLLGESVAGSGVMEMVTAYYSGVPIDDIVPIPSADD